MVHFQREEGRREGGVHVLRISAPFMWSTFDGRLFPLFLKTSIVNKWLQIYENHIYIYIYIYIYMWTAVEERNVDSYLTKRNNFLARFIRYFLFLSRLCYAANSFCIFLRSEFCIFIHKASTIHDANSSVLPLSHLKFVLRYNLRVTLGKRLRRGSTRFRLFASLIN